MAPVCTKGQDSRQSSYLFTLKCWDGDKNALSNLHEHVELMSCSFKCVSGDEQ